MRLKTAGCCDCKLPCNLECRSKGGLAELCGFEEFTDPSTPPKRYRRKTLAGEVTVCTWTRLGGGLCTPPVVPEGIEGPTDYEPPEWIPPNSASGFELPPATIPVTPDIAFPRSMPDPDPEPGETRVAAGFTLVRNDNNGGRVWLFAYLYAKALPQTQQGVSRVRLRAHWEYRIQGGGTGFWFGRPLPWLRLHHTPVPGRHLPGFSGQLSGALPAGASFSAPDVVVTGDQIVEWHAPVGTVALVFFDLLFHSNFEGKSYGIVERRGAFVFPPYVEATSERRVYDGATTYDAATCALSIDSTVAITTSATGCEPEGEGTPEATPTAIVPRIGAEIEVTPTDRTQTADAVCYVNTMGRDVQITADVSETLSEEDTEAAAIERAVAEIDDWTGGECDLTPAFITQRLAGQTQFAFRQVQVRAQLGVPVNLEIGHDYRVTISFFNRAVGSGGDWVPAGSQELEITADEPVEYTPWIDVPQEVGMETAALTCRYEDITPPEEA
jgi:hypothetical protein